LKARVDLIQDRNHDLMQRAAALMDQLDAIAAAKAAGANRRSSPALELQRKAQWRLDFIAAENSMGFHAPQEAANLARRRHEVARDAKGCRSEGPFDQGQDARILHPIPDNQPIPFPPQTIRHSPCLNSTIRTMPPRPLEACAMVLFALGGAVTIALWVPTGPERASRLLYAWQVDAPPGGTLVPKLCGPCAGHVERTGGRVGRTCELPDTGTGLPRDLRRYGLDPGVLWKHENETTME
jgi:hypothetical protein